MVLLMKEDIPYKMESHRVETPDGTLFVNIVEDDNRKPIMIQVSGMKTGTPAFAWADALSRLCNIALNNGVDFMTLVEELSNITSSKAIRLVSGAAVRSGPEGFAVALMRYRDSRQEAIISDMTELDEEDLDIRPRWRKHKI